MLHLFRQLRRLELRKRSGRYFVYALGEIVLIVIGILIALQIQNWNQGRHDRIEERYLLEELADNLNQEAERLEMGVEGQAEQIERFEGIKGFFESRSTSKEEFEHNLHILLSNFAFNPITSAYDTMKAGGVGFSSRELKAELFQYYDLEQPLLLTNLSRQRSINENLVDPLFAKHLKYLNYGTEEGSRAVPKDIEDPEFQEAVLGIIVLLGPNVSLNLNRSKALLERNHEILALVK